MKKHLLLTITTMVLLACSVMPMTQRPADVSAEEYAVYSALLANTFVDADKQDTSDEQIKVKLLVIKDQTSTDSTTEVDSAKTAQYFRQAFPTLTEEVVKDYRARNIAPAQLKDSFDLKLKHVLIGKQKLQKIFKGAGWWQEFYKRYPNSEGLVVLSRVGFNTSMNQVLVYIGHTCGGLCGTGHYVMLEKGAGGWRVVKRLMVWIS